MAKKVEESAEKKVAQAVYSYSEIIEGYKRFGVPKECVMAALRNYKNKQMSIEDAQKLISKFMSGRVI